MTIKRNRAFLLVIDVQERLLPAMHAPEAVVTQCEILIQAARKLGLPLLVSEQYPRGLGPTIERLREQISPEQVYEKLHFSCADDSDLAGAMAALDRDQAILCGIESHVCVSQTALGLRARDYEVLVVADATTSRDPIHVPIALDRLRDAGAQIVVTEQVLFECLEKAGTDLFRGVSRLIK